MRKIYFAKRSLLCFLLALPFWNSSGFAQLSGAEFLTIGAGRALGMGGAFVALADDETSALWNPAGIANTLNFQGYLTYVDMFNGLASYNFGAAALQLGPDLAAAISLVRLSIDNIPRYGPLQGSRFDRLSNRSLQSTGEPQGFFNSADNAIFFTIGKAWNLEVLLSQDVAPYTIPIRVSLGASMKMLQRNLERSNASAQGLDFGAVIELQTLGDDNRPQRSLALGVSLFDVVSSRLNWSTGTGYADPLPPRLVVGVAVKQSIPSLRGELHLSVDGTSSRLNRLRLGGEYIYHKFFALRAGWKSEGWSVGTGLNLGHFILDYSFATHDLGASHRIGGGVRF